MKPKITIAVLVLLIAGYIGYRTLMHFIGSIRYEFISSKGSPDGRFVITELRSTREGAHAPYGQHLVLSTGELATPDKGHVIFAGYCSTLSYSWSAKDEIIIACDDPVLDTDPVRTKSTRAFGIEIKHQYRHDPAAAQ